MNQNSPFGFPPIDPSKMDPKALMELSRLIQQLPPDQLSQMQSLMHNMMAGFDVRKQMEEFEKTLPAGFRDKLMGIMGSQFQEQAQMAAAAMASAPSVPSEAEVIALREPSASAQMDLHEARMTILRAVAEGEMRPEEAERLLFSGTLGG